MSICEFHPRCCIKIGLGYQPWPARQFDCTYDDSSFVDALRLCHGYPPLHCHPFYCHHDQFHFSVISSILPLRYFESITASLFSLILHHDDMMEKIFRNDSSVCFGGDPPPTNSEIIICSFLWRASYKPPLSIVSGPGIPPTFVVCFFFKGCSPHGAGPSVMGMRCVFFRKCRADPQVRHDQTNLKWAFDVWLYSIFAFRP